MKTKITVFGFLLSLLLTVGCDDSIDSIGMNMLPESERITARIDSFSIIGKTIKADSIYAKTVNGLLGRFIDPVYGDITAGYLCQFVPPSNSLFEDFADNIVTVESIYLHIAYASYTGDSLAPMEVTAHPVTKPLVRNNYAYTQPDKAKAFFSEYYDENNTLGKTAYTAWNKNLSDVRNASDTLNMVDINLPMDLATILLEEYKNKKGEISEAFLAEHLPGVYLKSTFGSGCLINVNHTILRLKLKRQLQIKSVLTENDSIDYDYLSFYTTKEVIQVNSYAGNDEYLTADNDKMYIKSPTGIFTELTIPIKEIRDSVEAGALGKRFSSVQLILEAEPKPESAYPLNFPGTGAKTPLGDAVARLLLIEVDENESIINDFFEEKRDPNALNNITSYVTSYNSISKTYSFDNIANMIQAAMDNDKESLTVRLIPIQIISSVQTSYYGSSVYEYSPENYLYPSAVTLKKDGLQVKILSADLKQKQ